MSLILTETRFKDVKIPFPPFVEREKINTSNNNRKFLNIFPVFIDYDLELLRPRGLSGRIDFFSLGKLTQFLESADKINSIIYLKKSEFFFDNGFFLMDFKQIQSNFNLFVENIKNLGFDKIYLEKSGYMESVFFEDNLSGVEIFFVEFV